MSVAYDNNGVARRGYVPAQTRERGFAPTPQTMARASKRRTVWYLRRLHIRVFGKTLVLTRREALERAGAAVIVFVAVWAGLTTGAKLWP